MVDETTEMRTVFNRRLNYSSHILMTEQHSTDYSGVHVFRFTVYSILNLTRENFERLLGSTGCNYFRNNIYGRNLLCFSFWIFLREHFEFLAVTY